MDRHFSFASEHLLDAVADDGRGTVAAARVLERAGTCGLAFLDLVEVPPGASVGRHRHGPSDEELYVVVSGRGRYRLDGEWVDVGPGSWTITGAGGEHAWENSGDSVLRMVVVDVTGRG